MKCPKCKGRKSRVSITRKIKGEDIIKRRRVCKQCGFAWYTVEHARLVDNFGPHMDGKTV